MFADSTPTDFNSVAANEFAARANGGVRFVTNSGTGAGVGLTSGDTSWNVLSAKSSKENFSAIDSVDVLEKVASLPVQRWNYTHQDDSIQHIGPFAEDFHAAFGLHGADNRTISSQDLDGVALAAIQGLNMKLESDIAILLAQNAALAKRLNDLEASLAQVRTKPGD